VCLLASYNCSLLLPETLGEGLLHRADSVIFLENPSSSSLANPTGEPIFHWITDYEDDGMSPKSHGLHRVMKSVVSGLTQRRSLGYPGHFVFGMAQRGNRLEILAGTWVLKQRILGSQETTQTESPLQDVLHAQAEAQPGPTVVPTNGGIEQSSHHRKARGDTSVETSCKEDDYQVHEKVFRSFLRTHSGIL
jgi:hypothetical protein